MLERCAGKLARTVLRRGGGGNVSSLSDRFSSDKDLAFSTILASMPCRVELTHPLEFYWLQPG